MGGGESRVLAAPPDAGTQARHLGLYVHLPFCASRCAYCDFHSQLLDESLLVPLGRAIMFHLRQLPVNYPLKGRTVDSVFLGGGTPSIWPLAWLCDLLAGIARYLPLRTDAEITLEANPDTLHADKLKSLRGAGYNRLSLGVQSFNALSLKRLGRSHQPGQVIRALEWARRADFSNISLDLIYGLPHQQLSQASQDVAAALALKPEHLSLYQLSLNPDTVLGGKYIPGQAPMPGEERVLAMETEARNLCEQAGLRRYEVSNYARSGFHCRHNTATWQGSDYLALGPGAHGHWGARRWANLYELPAYIAAWRPGGRMACEFEEKLSPAQMAAEIFMLGLRTRRGVDLAQVSRIIARPALVCYAEQIKFIQEQAWGELRGDYLLPTNLGLDMADRAALEFM